MCDMLEQKKLYQKAANLLCPVYQVREETAVCTGRRTTCCALSTG